VLTTREDVEARRYEIVVDGTVAGFIDYHDRKATRTLIHTEMDPAYEGQGLGSTLIRFALDDALAKGLSVLPVCPFVRSYIERHSDDYLELVPADQRERFNLLPSPRQQEVAPDR
jgi:predicted GNAT family acetyltransferase